MANGQIRVPNEEPTVYPIKTVHTGNDSKTDSFSIPAGWDFYVTELIHKKTGNADVDYVQVLKKNLIGDSAKSVAVELLAGSPTARYPLAKPLYIPGGQTCSVKVTDKTGAANTVEIAFHGVLRFTGVQATGEL